MASAVTSNKFASNFAAKSYKHVPGASTAQVLTPDSGTTKIWVPMQGFDAIVAQVLNFTSTSSSGPTLVDIVAATDSSGTNVTTIVSSGTLASITAGDYMFVEATAEQINEVGKAAGYNFTHVSVRITTSNSSDAQAVNLMRFLAKAPSSALSANAIT